MHRPGPTGKRAPGLARNAVLALIVVLAPGAARAAGEAPPATPLAPPADPGAAEAARILSRYPAGRVPSAPLVLDALDVLGRAGGTEHLPLLRSLAAEEPPGAVRTRAEAALARAECRLAADPPVPPAAPRDGGEAPRLAAGFPASRP